MTDSDNFGRPHRKRGILLRELDRTRDYVIRYSGRRWEVIDQVPDAEAPAPAPATGCVGAAEGAPAPARDGAPGHAAADLGTGPGRQTFLGLSARF